MKVLITGAAGFVGFHVASATLKAGHEVLGVDSFNDYYDVSLKSARARQLEPHCQIHRIDINDIARLRQLCAQEQPDAIIHLAAQAGVRHSFEKPMSYAHSNLSGQVGVLELQRHTPSVRRLIYASSSSVYSGTDTVPFSEDTPLETPKSLYAATKMADELLSRTYSKLYGLDQIGLRFFTVYGPWGRPDMAYWTFTEAVRMGQPLTLFNFGDIKRDFTYIDDVVAAIGRMLDEVSTAPALTPQHRIYNIGNHTPTPVPDMISLIEKRLGRDAIINRAALPPGDMVETYADVARLQADYNFSPSTPLATGLNHFIDWYLDWIDGKYAI